MENQTGKIPIFLTRLKVFRFKCDPNYSIPQKHHINMVQFRGCSKKALSSYLRMGHSVSYDAVTTAVEDPSCLDALKILLQYKNYMFTDEHIAVLRERLGIEWLVERIPYLNTEETRRLLSSEQTELLKKYLNCFVFGEVEEAMLLKLHDVELTTAYLATKSSLKFQNCSLLLSYTEGEVYEAYFKHCKPMFLCRTEAIDTQEVIACRTTFDKVCHDLIINKPIDIFEIMCKCSRISEAMQMLLIGSKNLEKIKIYLKWRRFDKSLHEYLVQNSSDEVFEYCVLNQAFEKSLPDAAYKRMFEKKNRNILNAYIKEFPLLSSAWEIKLLTEVDNKLAKEYVNKHKLSSTTVAYVLSYELDEQFNVTQQSITFPDWEAEAILFQNGSESLIRKHLFVGNKLFEPSDFGEGILFQHATADLLELYMNAKNYCLGTQAQKALLLRKDAHLISLFLKDNDFDIALMPLFIETAELQIVIDYLLEHSACSSFKKYNSPKIAIALFERGNIVLANYALAHCVIDESAEIALVQYAAEKVIVNYFEKRQLRPKAEAELLRRGSEELVKKYFSRYVLSPVNEINLLNSLDESLVACYLSLHQLKDTKAKKVLGI